MPLELVVTVVAVFVSIALASGSVAARMLSRTAPEVKRLRRVAGSGADAGPGALPLTDTPVPARRRRTTGLRKSKDERSRLHRRLAAAGCDSPEAAKLYSTGQLLLPLTLGAVPMLLIGPSSGWPVAALAAIVGYMVPDLLLSRRVAQRRKAIQNGLPDAIDLLIVCIEAGSSLDQAIVKASEELEIAVPAVAEELRMVATEIRAGKPRLEAFQDFARRTGVEDVRALVAMLIQTDRFGTSIAQALRTHAQTSRTRRRQQAEERASTVGVKLVFPLVLCLLPALYVVCLGPVAIRILRTL